VRGGPAGSRRRILGVGLLLPALLLHHPPALAAEPAAPKPPAKKLAPKPQRHAPRQEASAPHRFESESCTHVVRAGDSIARLAVRYGVRRQALIDANKLARPEALRLGQRLTVPNCSARAEVQKVSVGADGSITARVGPRRIPTRLFLGVPELNGRAIDFAWPVEGQLASQFGRRRNGWHAGVDIKADVGTPILAAAAGVVIYSGWAHAYGRLVRIEHDNGFLTAYAHNLQNFVEVGDRVEAGQVIGMVGRSGRASAYHLHFEVRLDGMAYNPAHLLPPIPEHVAKLEEGMEPEEDDEDE
jgi:murein DD-endopeptidase MepM/ murein hydrolase activator NlpD